MLCIVSELKFSLQCCNIQLISDCKLFKKGQFSLVWVESANNMVDVIRIQISSVNTSSYLSEFSKENECNHNGADASHCLKQITVPNVLCIPGKYKSDLQQLLGFYFMSFSFYCATSQQVSQPATLIALHSFFMGRTYKNKKIHHVVLTSCKVSLFSQSAH